MERIVITPENTEEALGRALTVLRDGGLVVYPTETVYGVGVDATSADAVSRLLKFKNRPAGKPISVLVASVASAERTVALNDAAYRLYDMFLPGPVTVVSKDGGSVDPRLVSELGTLGVRISSHPVAQSLAERAGMPITATSANASGKARPYSVETMLKGLSASQKGLIDLVLDVGELPRNEPSTVIDTTTETQEVVRAGSAFLDLVKPMVTTSPEETIAYAARLMGQLSHAVRAKAVVFALEGDMGAGKTHFAKGIAEAMGITRVVASPTYTIQKEYKGEVEGQPARLMHMDCWRLEQADPAELGLDEYVHPGNVMVIEWANPLLAYLQAMGDDLVGYRILIGHTSESERTIRVAAL